MSTVETNIVKLGTILNKLAFMLGEHCEIGMDSLLAFEDPSDEFLHKSMMWSCKQRRILHCWNFMFTSLGQAGVQSKTCQPNEVASEALQKVLEPM
mmetsp:Transcript_33036/g.48513  ORF Transcript_33036/g.48513 Transcript_33036/m.48513 type:complete len:96 (+) Transcript_33036:188-475(+)